jgi:hypothetical protein
MKSMEQLLLKEYIQEKVMKMSQRQIKTDNCVITYSDDTENTVYDLLTDLLVEYVNDLHKRPVIEKNLIENMIGTIIQMKNKE